MIDLTTLAKQIEDRLNVDVPSFKSNTVYLFNVMANEGEYKKAYREENSNTVVKFINAMLTVSSDDKAGIVLQSLNIEINTDLDFLIPDIDQTDETADVSNYNPNYTFKDAIIDHINDVLALPTQDIIQEGGINYLVTAEYSSVTVGIAEIRNQVANSLSASVSINYSIVAQGFPSSDVRIYANKLDNANRIYYARLDISRISTMESNIKSNSSNSTSGSSIQGTTLQFVITKPNRLDLLDQKILDYLIYGNKEPFYLFLHHPLAYTDTPSQQSYPYEYAEEHYLVVVSEAAEGAEGVSVPGLSCTLVEYLDPVNTE